MKTPYRALLLLIPVIVLIGAISYAEYDPWVPLETESGTTINVRSKRLESTTQENVRLVETHDVTIRGATCSYSGVCWGCGYGAMGKSGCGVSFRTNCSGHQDREERRYTWEVRDRWVLKGGATFVSKPRYEGRAHTLSSTTCK